MADPTQPQAAQQPNIAETLARVLPTATLLHPDDPQPGDILRIAVPKNFDLLAIDTESLLEFPRRTKAAAKFDDVASFLAYVARHSDPFSTVAWCDFNPQTFSLAFRAVIDDHSQAAAGWRGHQAGYEPALSAEWKAWKTKDRTPFEQVAFAEWLQEHEDDIASANGLPTSLQMLAMATDFIAQEEHVLKTAVKIQSGGVRLTYIADADKGTTEAMQMFERFGLGIPVFHGGPAWGMTTRLKYRSNAGKVSFSYELVRPDRIHEHAALELIDKVRIGLGSVPLLMGSCA
jgi:uncharacterized protein YfdQ (DUF2303 family)